MDAAMDEHAAAPVIFTTDANGLVSSWNRAAELLFGYTAEGIIGLPVSTLFPDEADARPGRLPVATVRDDEVADDRWCLRHDGTRFRSRHVAVALSDASTLVGMARIVRPLELLTNSEQVASPHAPSSDPQREPAKASASLRVESAELRYSEEARLRLLRRLVVAQEQERRRIARDLHDHLGQQLTSLRLKVERARHLAGSSATVAKAFDEIESMLEHVDRDIDFLSWELRPAALDDLGLVRVLDQYVREWAHHAQLPAHFHAEGLTDERIAPEVEATLYRIAQEALNNVAKHARARTVSVLLERQGRNICLIVEDNGIGMDAARPTATQVGLTSMRERAAVVGGTLDVEPTAGGGTTVRVRVPLSLTDVGLTRPGNPGHYVGGASGGSDVLDGWLPDDYSPPRRLQELQRAVDARDEFIATVAHELRNPIAPLMFQVRMAIDKAEQNARTGAAMPADWTQSQLRRVEHRLHRLLETLDRLLDVSRLSTGRIDLALDDVDLVDLLQDVLASFEAELAMARCSLRVSAPPVVIGRWDRLRLDQVLRNLISNAIRFGAGHPIDVRIGADDTTASVTVRDHGIGISKDKQDVIFERFERGPEATRSGGFGVGLWVVKTVCTAMGGTVAVESVVGNGAAFTVTLPRRSDRTGHPEVTNERASRSV
jgi:PAS domain S-box-containing protein